MSSFTQSTFTFKKSDNYNRYVLYPHQNVVLSRYELRHLQRRKSWTLSVREPLFFTERYVIQIQQLRCSNKIPPDDIIGQAAFSALTSSASLISSELVNLRVIPRSKDFGDVRNYPMYVGIKCTTIHYQ